MNVFSMEEGQNHGNQCTDGDGMQQLKLIQQKYQKLNVQEIKGTLKENFKKFKEEIQKYRHTTAGSCSYIFIGEPEPLKIFKGLYEEKLAVTKILISEIISLKLVQEGEEIVPGGAQIHNLLAPLFTIKNKLEGRLKKAQFIYQDPIQVWGTKY